jgi:quercetin dioxygenase-like cupin family protein
MTTSLRPSGNSASTSKKLGNASATNADAKRTRPTLTAPRRPALNRSSRADDSAGQTGAMRRAIVLPRSALEFSESYVEGDPEARWRSASGHSPSAGASASGSSVIEVPARCRLPRHIDSAEETIVVTAGAAEVVVGDERTELSAGDIAVVPEDTPHEVRNAGAGTLRFVAVYAAPEVITRYEREVQPDGTHERQTVG